MNIYDNNAFRELMEIRGEALTTSEVSVSGQDPFFPSPFKFGETAAGVLAARAVAANDLWELRTGRRQKIELSVETAAATCLGGTAQTQRKNSDGINEGIQASEALQHMVSITQPWKCADGSGSCLTSISPIWRRKFLRSSDKTANPARELLRQ